VGSGYTNAWGVPGNTHVTGYQVPLVFPNSLLPRIHISANASSISILPTILDLLIQSSSLGQDDIAIASALIKQYEGQSLLRPSEKYTIIGKAGPLLSSLLEDHLWPSRL
jgi:hypothetical protein